MSNSIIIPTMCEKCRYRMGLLEPRGSCWYKSSYCPVKGRNVSDFTNYCSKFQPGHLFEGRTL